MRRWTKEEDGIIKAFGNQGAAKVSKMLHLRCGTLRTQKAVECRAQRIGASLTVYGVCIGCGRRVEQLCPDGLCKVCHERRMLQVTRERAKTMKAREDAAYEAEAKAIAKERAVWRARISNEGKQNG